MARSPKISLKTTKNDPTLEPSGGRIFSTDVDFCIFIRPGKLVHPSSKNIGHVPKFWKLKGPGNDQPRFTPVEKFGLSVETGSSHRRPRIPFTCLVAPRRFSIVPWKIWSLYPDPVPEILRGVSFFGKNAPDLATASKNQKSVLQFCRRPYVECIKAVRSLVLKIPIGKCSVPARYGRLHVKFLAGYMLNNLH